MNITSTTDQHGCTMTNMCIAAGETVARQITVSINGTPVNYTGYTIKMRVGFPTPLDLNTTNGGITITGQGFQLNIPDTISSGLPVGGYPYDLWTISGGGEAYPLLAGTFHVYPNVTPIP